MTNKEKFIQVFGITEDVFDDVSCVFRLYQNDSVMCNNFCEECRYFNFWGREYKPEVGEKKDEEKETDRQSDRRDLSPIDIYNYLRTANPSEYGVIYSLAAFKMSETMSFEDFLNMVFANLFAVSDKFDAEVMYKAQDMILKYYKKEE